MKENDGHNSKLSYFQKMKAVKKRARGGADKSGPRSMVAEIRAAAERKKK